MERTIALLCACLLLLLPAVVSSRGQGPDKKRRPIKVDDLFRFKRVADPQVSPDGKHVAYVITTVDLAGNKSSSAIWLAPTDKGEPRVLTTSGKKDRHPRWSPDGKYLLFESNRSGSNQLWAIALSGGEAVQLTTISSDAGNGLWSPDGKSIAFTSSVYPEFSAKPFKEADAANKKKQEEVEKNPVKAQVFTRLFYRHWDSYVEDKRQHLFVMPWNAGKGGEPKNVTPGDRDAAPTSDTFSVGDDFTFSPDSKYLLYTATPAHDESWSTNFDILRVNINDGEPVNLTKDNPAADGAPRFSPDGSQLAFRAKRGPATRRTAGKSTWSSATRAAPGRASREASRRSSMARPIRRCGRPPARRSILSLTSTVASRSSLPTSPMARLCRWWRAIATLRCR